MAHFPSQKRISSSQGCEGEDGAWHLKHRELYLIAQSGDAGESPGVLVVGIDTPTPSPPLSRSLPLTLFALSASSLQQSPDASTPFTLPSLSRASNQVSYHRYVCPLPFRKDLLSPTKLPPDPPETRPTSSRTSRRGIRAFGHLLTPSPRHHDATPTPSHNPHNPSPCRPQRPRRSRTKRCGSTPRARTEMTRCARLERTRRPTSRLGSARMHHPRQTDGHGTRS